MRFRGWVRAAIVIALLCVTSVASGQWKPINPADKTPTKKEVAEARERFDKALELYKVEGDFDTALAELLRAYDIAPSYQVLYNIGQVARTSRDYVIGLRALEAYLEYGGAKIEPGRRKKVEKDIRDLRGLVAEIELVTNVDGASVVVDDVEVGTTPLAEPLLVSAGRRRISVSHDGETKTKMLTLAGREKRKVELLLPVPGSPPPPPDDDDDDEPSDDPKTGEPKKEDADYTWIGWVVTGTLTAGAIATGVASLVANSSLEDETYVGNQPPDDLESQESTVTALSITTDILAASAVVAFGVTLYFTLSDDDEPTGATVGLQVRPTSMALQGTF